MFNKLLVAAASSMFALSAFAGDANQVRQSVQLTDGSSVLIYADGKMAMQDQFGRAVYMEPGHAMQAKDGKTVTMNGNEVARLEQQLTRERVGG